MISGDEWREAFFTGLATGICGIVALVVLGVIIRAVWLARRAAEADRDSADYAAAARAAFADSDPTLDPAPFERLRRLTEQDIVNRAARQPCQADTCGGRKRTVHLRYRIRDQRTLPS